MIEFRASRSLRKSKYSFHIDKLFFAFIVASGGILAVPIMLFRLSRKDTTAIRIGGDIFEVEYRRYFKTKIARFERSGILLKLVHYEDDTRDPSYYVVLIYDNNKLKYEVDSRDGFSRETLVSVITTFANGGVTSLASGQPA